MEFIKRTIEQQVQMLIQEKQDEKSIFYNDKGYSWKEISFVADRMAYDMMENGIGKGDRIAILCKNSPIYISALFAITKIGATAVLMNPSYKTFEINRIMEYAQLSGMFVDHITMPRIQRVESLRILNYIGMDAWDRLMNREPLDEQQKDRLRKREQQVSCYDFAAMLFTSGSTGIPKGIELTHYGLLNVALRAQKAMHWCSKDIVCFSLPLFHSFGLSTGILAALYHKGKVCMNDDYHSLSIMKVIDQYHCTVLNGVPTMFLSIYHNPNRKNYNLSSLNSGIIAGSGVYESDFLKISRELDIPHLMQSYGQTEASPSITFSNYEDSSEKRAKSVGVAIPDVEIRIRDLETGLFCGYMEPGEIEIRGFNTMKGYFRKEEESKEVLLPDGWMKTGDMGKLDEEGNLYVCGRKKEMIIRGGENISPQEIEEVIVSMNGVEQVKVFGAKAEVIQEEIVACIVTHEKYTEEEIRQFTRRYLADYKIPKYVYFLPEFPKNSSGKIDTKALKHLVGKE